MYKFSPSDLTFLWDECPRCFYLKVKEGINRPSMPFPGIFSRIDKYMKDLYDGQPAQSISLLLPPGVMQVGGKMVESAPVTVPGHSGLGYFRGKYDSIILFEDGTYGVVDFKTGEVKAENIPFYMRQLHAYAYALENPASGTAVAVRVSAMGLFTYEPQGLREQAGQLALTGKAVWQPCPLDREGFLAFMAQVMDVLEQDEPPSPGEKCSFCAYRSASRQHGY